MARPTLFSSRKLLKLAKRLDSKALAIGSLELLWHVANENGNPIIGDASDVESIADWRGKEGELVAALVECGTGRAAGFLDQLDDGRFEVHDFWHHAPGYVANRRNKEDERTTPKTCEYCGSTYFNRDPRSTTCNGRCRVSLHRKKKREENSPDNQPPSGPVTEVKRSVTECNTTPSTQHPAPVTSASVTRRGGDKGIGTITVLGEQLKKSVTRSPPQESGRRDARSFDTIKQAVATLCARLESQDSDYVHRMAGQSHRLTLKQVRVCVKQLREDGFFLSLERKKAQT